MLDFKLTCIGIFDIVLFYLGIFFVSIHTTEPGKWRQQRGRLYHRIIASLGIIALIIGNIVLDNNMRLAQMGIVIRVICLCNMSAGGLFLSVGGWSLYAELKKSIILTPQQMNEQQITFSIAEHDSLACVRDQHFSVFALILSTGINLYTSGWTHRSPITYSPLFYHEMKTGVCLLFLGGLFLGTDTFFPLIYRATYHSLAFLIFLVSTAVIVALIHILLFLIKEVLLPFGEKWVQQERLLHYKRNIML